MASLYNVQRARSFVKKYHHQRGRCIWCGKQTKLWKAGIVNKSPLLATREHILPKSMNCTWYDWPSIEDYERDNIVMACAKCNNERGNNPIKFEPHPDVFVLLPNRVKNVMRRVFGHSQSVDF